MSDPVPALLPVPDAAGRETDLARLVVLSVGRETPTEDRERLAERLLDAPSTADVRLDEWLILHTCHRVELAAVIAPGYQPPAIPGMRLTRGAGAVARLMTVAAGLDSSVLAEEQLLGQVRDAYAAALAQGHTGAILNELIRRAIRLGKRARAMATPGTDRSLAGRALGWALPRRVDGPALVLGTGAMARELAVGLAASGLAVRIASTDPERAAALVAAVPGTGHGIVAADRAVESGPWSIVAAATRVRQPLLRLDHLAALRGARVIDLCAPPAVEPELARSLGDALLDLDRLAQTGTEAAAPLSSAAVRRLRRAITEEQSGFERWLAGRSSSDAIGLLHEHVDALRQRHLDRLRRRGIVEPHQLAAVEHMAHAMLAELLHVPTILLREGGDDAERIRELFGIPV